MSDDPKPIKRVSARKYRGLGDVVHAVAHPVAVGLDRLLGTDVQNCKSCSKRRDSLNRWLPLP